MRLLGGKDVAAEDVAICAVFGVITGILMLWVVRWVIRRERKLPPGSPTATNIKRAISTGQLPEHASAQQWVPELDKIIRQERHMVWIGPLMFGRAMWRCRTGCCARSDRGAVGLGRDADCA
jgi:hypothetical protein